MPSEGWRIEVEGLNELKRSVGNAGSDARKALARELKGVAEFARDMAVHEAHAKGLDQTGDLIRGLKAGVRGNVGYVRDTAQHGGYPYPSRIEYEDNGAHAFLRPAIETGRAAIEDRLAKVVEDALDHI